MELKRICNTCNKEKDITEYYKPRKNVISKKCKTCVCNFHKDARRNGEKEPEKIEIIVGEIWKDVIGYEGLYMVSNFGRVKGLKRDCIHPTGGSLIRNEKLLKNGWSNGYKNSGLSKNGKMITYTVHRIVISNFLPNIENKPSVNHINGIKTDNRLENLEWCTSRENQAHSQIRFKDNCASKYIGVTRNGDKNWRARISIHGIRKTIGNYKTEIEAHEAYQSHAKYNK